MKREIKITALLSRSYAWARINGWGLHARHESAGPLPFPERDKKRPTLFGWRFKLLGPLHRTAPPAQRPVVCRSQAQSEIWGRILSAAEKLRSEAAPCAQDLRGEATPPTAPSPGVVETLQVAEAVRGPFRVRGEDGYFTAADLLWLQKDNARLRELLLRVVKEWVTCDSSDAKRSYCKHCYHAVSRQRTSPDDSNYQFVCDHTDECLVKRCLEALAASYREEGEAGR